MLSLSKHEREWTTIKWNPYKSMDTDERLQRIESDIHGMKADMSDIKVNVARITATIESTFPHLATKESVAKIETTIESTLPHVATKAEVEEAKHELRDS